jgi:uncharacterized DUF497 family protein
MERRWRDRANFEARAQVPGALEYLNYRNLRKHGVDLSGCAAVFDRPMITYEDEGGYGEQRFVSVGWAHERVVVLIWTDRDGMPRLISCREGDRSEYEAYFFAYASH